MYKESEIFQFWYQQNKRDLPWRNTKEPYEIWISEIILQQTRVVQGYEYYQRFIKRFPDVLSLANASQKEVLKYWQGLGYYSRARNLLETAQRIKRDYKGIFPKKYEEILSLKGIGEYTAAAIVSFAWNQPYPVIDGNVYRVLGRLFAITTPIDTEKGKKEYRTLAELLMPPQKSGIHNQAVMEFGALQCTPRNPKCEMCPFIGQCLGYATGNPLDFPVKKHKVKTRDRFFYYFFVTDGKYTYLHQRSGNDIWKGLYEFPLIEMPQATDFTNLQSSDKFKELFSAAGDATYTLVTNNLKHVLSHQILHVACFSVAISRTIKSKSLVRVHIDQLSEYPTSKLIDSLLKKIDPFNS